MVDAVATRPLNAAYRAVAFTGPAPESDKGVASPTHTPSMKNRDREMFRVVESNPEMELFKMVVQMNFKLHLDKYQLMAKLESQTNQLQLRLEDGSSLFWTEC
ncbi:hypothetical protein Taro_049724 [Colocasia esculenta]|uniref:Uncharacterized protein n=1 Tax=Colocasia esculenta TaxID=4460 RepID=A0A843XBJ1_COLES|nr:hypothetical protein [Colocasia esculenta]